MLASLAAAAPQSVTPLSRQSAGSTQLFVGARIVTGNGTAAIDRGALLVRGGRIVAVGAEDQVDVPAGAERIALGGRTIIPGLVSTHGHVADTQGLEAGPGFYTETNIRRQLQLYARYGITTIFSLGGDGDAGFRLRNEQNDVPLDRARVFLAGPVIIGSTPEEVRGMVDRVAAMKPDLIKIRVDDNLGTVAKMTPAVYTAVIDQAHARGLRVAAHVFYLEDAKRLLDAGVDFIAHSIRDKDVDAELIAKLTQRDICVCPTLTREVSTFVYETTPEFFRDPFFLRSADPAVLAALQDPKRQAAMRNSPSAQAYKKALDVASRNLHTLARAGVRIAFGTDTGPPARFQGYFEHMELEMMVKAGLTPARALMSAMGDAARCMKAEGIGTLRPGAHADFVVLRENPLADIRATRSIESVWVGGRRVYP